MEGVMRSRATIRRAGMSARGARLIEPWVFEEAKPNTLLAGVEKAFFDALAAVDALEDRKTEAVQSGRFTSEGIASDALQFAAGILAPKLKRAKQVLDRARSEVASRRAKLTLPVDKTDVYGLYRRAELRTYLRGLPEKDRRAIGANIENLDPEMALAISEMPAALSGMLESDHQQLLDRALQTKHGDAIGEIADLEEAIKIAEGALVAARETLGEDVGGIAKLDEAAKPYEEQLGVLWLRKDVVDGIEAVRVFKQVTPTSGTWAEATPEEREAGQFFKDYNEWHAVGGVWPKVERKRDAA
jgi:hypothetical protein